MQRTTTFSDDLVKEGEAILLTFTKVRGEAFERTIKVAADLSARLGTDLKGSIRQVGLALQDPERGLLLLRRAGIAFTDSQKSVIKGFLETNQAAKAQDFILAELEKRFGGSAAAARDTLGGALSGLKNAFSDLFEGTKEGTSSAVSAINGLSKALADPDLKSGLDFLITGFAKLVEISVKALGLVGRVAKEVVDTGKTLAEARKITEGVPFAKLALQNPFAGAIAAQFALRNNTVEHMNAADPGGAVAGDVAIEKATTALEEINVTVRKIVDENGDLMRELQDSTKSAVERTSAEYVKLRTTLQFLFDQGAISKEQFNARLTAAQDEMLPEFDLNEIKAKYITLKRSTTEMGEFMKGVWQGVGRSIQSTLSDAIYDWRLSWKSLIDIARRALADIASAIITSGIKNAFQSQLSSSKSSGGWLAAVGKLFGLASGGQYDGPRIVGEDGPELVTGRGRVWNQRQMAFAGMGGANITYAPVFEYKVIEKDDPAKARQEIVQYTETRIAQSQSEFIRLLGRSGVEVKG